MTSTPSTLRAVLRLAWPAVVQGLLTTVVFFTDRLILGAYSDTALASMGISGPLLWSVFSIFGAISAGTMAVVGRRSGAGRFQDAGEVIGAVTVTAGLLGLVAGAGGMLLREHIVVIMAGGAETSVDVRQMAMAYMTVVFSVAPIKMMADAAFTGLQASGDTRSPMWISGLCGALNLGVSWLLVGGQLGMPSWGIWGAAVGTVSAFGLQAVLAGVVLTMTGKGLRIRFPRHGFWAILQPVARISVPAFAEKSIYHAAYIAFASLIGWLGDVAMTAHQALIAIESLGFIAAGGFGVAASAIVAQRLGAGDPDGAAHAGWIATGLSVLSLSCVSVLLAVAARPLVGIFSTDPAVIETGVRCLWVAALAQPLMALTDAMAGALRGAGDTKNPMRAAIAGPLMVRLTVCWGLAFGLDWGLLGIWVGSTLDWLVRGVFLSVIFARGQWKQVTV